MSELPMQTRELLADNTESERQLDVEHLTETARAVLERKLREKGEKFDEAKSVEVMLREPDSSPDARFAQAYLQRENHLDGVVVMRRVVDDEGKARYEVTRPGYENATLEYHWTEGGEEVKRGFSEGFYNEREGREPGGSSQARLPEVLDTDKVTDFDKMVAELNDTHFAKERASGKLIRKVRSGMARMALRNRR